MWINSGVCNGRGEKRRMVDNTSNSDFLVGYEERRMGRKGVVINSGSVTVEKRVVDNTEQPISIFWWGYDERRMGREVVIDGSAAEKRGGVILNSL